MILLFFVWVELEFPNPLRVLYKIDLELDDFCWDLSFDSWSNENGGFIDIQELLLFFSCRVYWLKFISLLIFEESKFFLDCMELFSVWVLGYKMLFD